MDTINKSCRHWQWIILALVVIIVAVLIVNQSKPSWLRGLFGRASNTVEIKTDRGIYSELPRAPIPAAGSITVDPVFGTQIMRVTDSSDALTYAGTYYSYWPTFNRTNTRLLVRGDGGVGFIRNFDPVNFKLGSKETIASIPGVGYPEFEGSIWSEKDNGDSDVLYSAVNQSVYAYNARTHIWTLHFDLASRLPAGEHFWQMSKSLDDDYFAFTRVKNDGSSYPGYVVYRKSTDTLIVKDEPRIDELTVSKNGQYVVVKFSNGDDPEQVILNTSTGHLEYLSDSAPDYSPGHGDAGTGSYAGYDNWRNQFNFRSLSDPHNFKTILDIGAWGSGAGHMSMLADNEDWALVSFGGVTDERPFANEIVQIATDGSGQFRRLFHHNSVEQYYYDTSRPNISRDGRYVAFSSNWAGAAGTFVDGGKTYNRTDLFVARINPLAPDNSSSVIGDPTPPTISLTSPSGGTTLSGTVTVSATATDNVGVAGVQFKSDGVNIGSEDTTSPYSVSWNTTTLTNASHILTAVARDAAGNTTTSSGITVTVSNIAQPLPPSGVISATSCTIASGASTCSSSLTWTTANLLPGGNTAVTRDNPANTTVSASTSGTNVSNTVNQGATTFFLYHNNVLLNSSTISAACAAGTTWNGTLCAPNTADTVAPLLTITKPLNNSTVPKNGNLQIASTASDNVGVSTIKITFDNVLLKTCTGVTACSATKQVKSITGGAHTITVTATDPAGNVTTKSVGVGK